MSDPYYNNNNQGYQSQYPQGGYNQQGGYQNQYPPQQSGGYGSQDFGPPRRQDSFGPPQHGGFQHGQQGHQYGQYDASNPQGHSQYYGDYNQQQQQQQYPPQHHQQQGYDYNQNQGYQQQSGGYNSQPQHQSQYGSQPTQSMSGPPQTAPQSTDPNAPNYDPNAPPMTDQDRGLLGAAAGAFGGHKLGGKYGHGILGMIGGAIAGSLAEDKLKDSRKHGHGQHGSQSSWGGSGKW